MSRTRATLLLPDADPDRGTFALSMNATRATHVALASDANAQPGVALAGFNQDDEFIAVVAMDVDTVRLLRAACDKFLLDIEPQQPAPRLAS